MGKNLSIKTGIFISILTLNCCSDAKRYPLPFDFDQPLEITKLPASLKEISGIVFYKKNELACVQDEKGLIYFYDLKKGKLRRNIAFAKDKDYEAIANVGDTLFVLCSNGEISEIDFTDERTESHTYSTFLSKQNNSEGLCYDPLNHRLLVACKGDAGINKDSRLKAIYAFNLDKRELNEIPAYLIHADSVEVHLKNHTPNFLSERLPLGNFAFEPSEVGIDPMTNDIYVLSAVGKTIMAMTTDGKIKFAYSLHPGFFKQPEGIAFSKDGSLYISDEGKGGAANLIKLKRN